MISETARSLTVSRILTGGLPNPPWMQIPPGRRPPLDEDPLHAAPSSLCREGMTDTCENITLPQTSFAGGKNTYFI